MIATLPPILAIYAKPPLPGRCKSRLASRIGHVAAADLAAALLHDACLAVAAVTEATPQLWRPPDEPSPDDGAEMAGFPSWIPTCFTHHVQCPGQLGNRMSHTIRHGLETGARAVLILGSDCITHDPESLRAALAALLDEPAGYADNARAAVPPASPATVIRPAADGGYVLVGQRLWQPEIFGDLPWGSATVLRQTRTLARRSGVRLRELPPTFDIDEAADLQALRLACRSLVRPHTQAWLAAHPEL